MTESIKIPAELREAWSTIRGDKEAIHFSASQNEIFSISAAIKAKNRKAVPGDLVEGEGVYVGQWKLLDRCIFNIYAAPDYLRDAQGERAVFTYKEAVKTIKEMKDWCGYNGAFYSGDTTLENALLLETYTGGWVIPTLGILRGVDTAGNEIKEDNVYAHRLKGEFAKIIECVSLGQGDKAPCWYWSCTQDMAYHAWTAMFNNGDIANRSQKTLKLSLCPVRFVRASS